MTERRRIKHREIREVRERLKAKQRGLCTICKRPLRHASLDHDHKTGSVRDVLCRICNTAEGKIRHWAAMANGGDSEAEYVRAILRYWRRHSRDRHGLLHPGKRRKAKKLEAKNG